MVEERQVCGRKSKSLYIFPNIFEHSQGAGYTALNKNWFLSHRSAAFRGEALEDDTRGIAQARRFSDAALLPPVRSGPHRQVSVLSGLILPTLVSGRLGFTPQLWERATPLLGDDESVLGSVCGFSLALTLLPLQVFSSVLSVFFLKRILEVSLQGLDAARNMEETV